MTPVHGKNKERRNMKKETQNKETQNKEKNLPIFGRPMVNDTRSFNESEDINVPTQDEPVIEKIDLIVGKIVNCLRLNVRETPDVNARILLVLGIEDELNIDIENSTETFYAICTVSGVEGYVRKEYVILSVSQ